jgi:Protein of unknown function (DUF3631)
MRFVGGWSQRFELFAPLAVAAIGTLPLPLMDRAVVVKMQRSKTEVERLDENDPSFPASKDLIKRWAATCSLAPDPEMPPSVRINRGADNWRVLLAIADSLGHGDDARAAAVELCGNRPDEDPGVVLLRDVQTVFLARGTDRISSQDLVEALIDLDDSLWHDWRGPNDDRPPRKLTQGELSRLLRPFEIKPKTVWPPGPRFEAKSRRGYLRVQFEAAWRSYCPGTDTPTHNPAKSCGWSAREPTQRAARLSYCSGTRLGRSNNCVADNPSARLSHTSSRRSTAR